jgi:hypothetical protein
VRIKVTYQMDQASLAALEKERSRRIVEGWPRIQATVSQILNEMVTVGANYAFAPRPVLDGPTKAYHAEIKRQLQLSPSGPPAGVDAKRARPKAPRSQIQVAALSGIMFPKPGKGRQ